VLIVASGGMLINNGTVDNYGAIENSGTFTNTTGTVNDYGTITGTAPSGAVTTASTVPQDFTATPGIGQAALSWTALTNFGGGSSISKYEVTNDNWTTTTDVTSGTTYTFTGLTNGTTHTFKVRGVNNQNVTLAEASATATPTGGGTPPPYNPGGNGGGGTNPPAAPDTSASSTTISNGGITLAGVSYPIEKQSDGSWLIVVPFGTDLTSLAITFALPTGATCQPPSGSPQDFSGGPITYTVTSANGTKTEQYVVRVNAAPATVTPGDIVDASGGGSAWTLNAKRNANGSYGVALIAPTSGLTSATRLPDGIYVVIGNAASWSGVSLALLDAEGNVIAGYDNAPFSGRGAGEPYRLRITGTVTDKAALEAISLSGIQFRYDDEPGVIYEQNFALSVTFGAIGDVNVNVDEGNGSSRGGGCSTGAGLAGALVLLAGIAATRRTRKWKGKYSSVNTPEGSFRAYLKQLTSKENLL
jgi:hypothetical protein